MPPLKAMYLLEAVLEHFCVYESHTVSRADLYLDFCCHDPDIQEAQAQQFVTRASVIRPYFTDRVLTGWDVGLGSDLAARIYNKTLETLKSRKEYMYFIWLEGGWNSIETIWRLEFQLRRPVLAGFGITTVGELVSKRSELWTYLTKEWLRFCIINHSDSNRARWALHPLWENLWDGGCGAVESPLRAWVQKDSAPERERILQDLCGPLSSLCAIENLSTLEAMLDWLVANLEERLKGNYSRKGLRLDHYVMELTKKKTRKFNLALNDQSLNNPGNFYH